MLAQGITKEKDLKDVKVQAHQMKEKENKKQLFIANSFVPIRSAPLAGRK